jgi:hypothetical protein
LECRALLTKVFPYTDYALFTSATPSSVEGVGTGHLRYGTAAPGTDNLAGIDVLAVNVALAGVGPDQPFVVGYVNVENQYTHEVGVVTSATATFQLEFSLDGVTYPDKLQFTLPMQIEYSQFTLPNVPTPYTNHVVTVGAATITTSALLPGTDLEFKVLGVPATIAPAEDASEDIPIYGEVKATAVAPAATVKEVDFSGDGLTPITKDPFKGQLFNTLVTYTKPMYLDANLNGDATDAGDHMDPVCYVQGSTATVAAHLVLKAADNDAKPSIEVKGTAADGLDVPATSATLEADKVTVDLGKTQLAKAFGTTINVYDPFTITWQISTDGGKNWSPAGASKDPVYVTLAQAKTDSRTPHYFETVVWLSCQNGKGAKDADEAIPKIFGAFTSQNVKTKAGKPLTYYANYRIADRNTTKLLEFGDGQCSSFVSLFLDMLKVQGIRQDDDYQTIVPKNSADQGFLVKSWTFGPNKGSGDKAYPYVNIPGDFETANTLGNSTSFQGRDGTYTFLLTPDLVRAANPIKGQNNANPASIFGNHQVAYLKVNGVEMFYDPSYGVTYKDLDDMSTQAIAGFYEYKRNFLVPKATLEAAHIDFKGRTVVGNDVEVNAYLFRENDTPAGQLKVERGSYKY